MDLVVGLVVAERFRLERELGVGGMGAVWAATHLITNKQVALKFMHTNSDELTARFVREAQTASAVRHPNVVDIHDVLPLPDGTPLMVMEMLTGEALAEKLARETKLSPVEAAQIMGPVVSAVAAAHAVGIVHRDLKPENIFLARYGTRTLPKVLDFGIAKLMPHVSGGPSESALTRTGSLLGTPYYMSPEQVFGEKDVDVRADVWALGVILYQCVTGLRPFEGDNFGQLLKSVTSGRFEPIENVAPWVPPQLIDVIVRMLRERNARLADLGEVEGVLMSIGGAPSAPGMPFSSPGLPSGSGRLPVTTPSAGFTLPHGPAAQAATAASVPALTPSPMVRSQTLPLSPTPPDAIPLRSSMGIKIGIAVLGFALLVGGGTYAVRHASSSSPTAAAAGTTTAASPTTTTTATLQALTPIAAPTHSDTVAAPGTVSPPRPSAKASVGTAAPRPSVSATATEPTAAPSASPTHTAGTGGLSTAVPF